MGQRNRARRPSLASPACLQIRQALELRLGCPLQQYRDFIDNQMLLLMAQQDRASRIFPHLYLVSCMLGVGGGGEVLWSMVGPLGKGTGAHSCPFQVCLRLQYLPGSSPRRSLLGTHGSSCGMWQGGPLSQDQ